MTKARKTIINVSDTPYYHCMGRCVRQTFLCGIDKLTGIDYSHRKQWIVDKLAELTNVFLIDVCAYSVMSNHYHVIIKINQEQARQLRDDEVIERWMMLFKGNVLIGRFLKGQCKTQAELSKVNEIVALWRERLSDISWFMRCLNETIAHMANEEDKCSGRFWEGRFKSQALLNEQALLSCMAYVDLNPIRAGLAESIDESEFTAIGQRIKQFSIEHKANNDQAEKPNKPDVQANKINKTDNETSKQSQVNLSEFIGSKEVDGIPYLFKDYLELVDWTGRAVREDKIGYINEKEPKILEKLGFSADIWLKSVNQFSDHFYSHIGTEDQLKAVCKESGLSWIAGINESRSLAV